MLVTAFETSSEVPKMEVVTKRLLNEEKKITERESVGGRAVLLSDQHPRNSKVIRCYHYHKLGHVLRNCVERIQAEKKAKKENHAKEKAFKVKEKQYDSDGSDSESTGLVMVTLKLQQNKRNCKRHDVLYVPKLSYNLLSVFKATEFGKMVQLVESSCKIVNASTQKVVSTATGVGSLYYLDCQVSSQQVNAADSGSKKEQVWH